MPKPRPIPLLDLKAQYDALRNELDEAVLGVMRSGQYILGEPVREFEAEFARYCGARHAVGVASGLAALELALRAAGIGPGDEVITAANTFVATVLAIVHAGATPVLVDAEEQTANLDLEQVEAAVTARTRAILPVHLYGQPAEMQPLTRLAKERGLVLIEDAAQAHGATYRGRHVGTFGDAGCYSFYPTKNLGAAGDGGMVLSGTRKLAETVRKLANYGKRTNFELDLAGYNERLDNVQAAILRVKLRHLDRWTELRRRHAAQYGDLLAGLPIALPQEAPNRRHVYHLYVIRTGRRAALAKYLAQHGIGTGVHYPIPPHRQKPLQNYPFAGQTFPVTERLADEVLSLPVYPELTESDIERVAASIRAFFTRRRRS